MALVLLIVAMPTGFPCSLIKNPPRKVLSKELLSRIDFLGFIILLAACAFFVVALEESGTRYAWSSALPITFLVLSGLLWIGFFAWERIVSREGRIQEPVFTWRFVKNRVFLGVLLCAPHSNPTTLSWEAYTLTYIPTGSISSPVSLSS